MARKAKPGLDFRLLVESMSRKKPWRTLLPPRFDFCYNRETKGDKNVTLQKVQAADPR